MTLTDAPDPTAAGITPPRDEQEAAALVDILDWAFVLPGGARVWMDRAGLESIRVCRIGERPAGMLVVLHGMGLWMHGRSVPMTGIAGVASAPEHRGRGVASTLLRSALQEMRERDVPLSTLYPATLPVYRRAGYEVAGGRYEVRVPCAELTCPAGPLQVRPVRDGDMEAVRAAWGRQARERTGGMDRSEYIWRRVFLPHGEKAQGFVAERAGAIEGYLYALQNKLPAGAGGSYDLELSDFVVLTAEAASALRGFLAHHASLARDVYWNAAPWDPLLAGLRERTWSARLIDTWMLRIVDVAGALRRRGYPVGLRGEVHFEVADDLLPDNRGRFCLEVSDGQGTVTRGGRGDVRLDVRDLAALYTGYLSALDLRLLGRLQASDEDARAAQAVFSGPAPTMAEMF